MPGAENQLTDKLASEILVHGPISFARFMELALYHPVHGYYRRSLKQVGCQGDFYTNVSVGSLFGQLLAYQMAAWLEALREPAMAQAADISSSARQNVPGTAAFSTLQLLEAGAHDGRLALDILGWFQERRPKLLDQLTYCILEPDQRLRSAQAESLRSFADRVRWLTRWEDLPRRSIRGIIFSNELLDAFPFHRLGWNASRKIWFEWRVDRKDERFCWVRSEWIVPKPRQTDQPALWQRLPEELAAVLPDDFTIDVCPAAPQWWSEAAARLQAGKLLTFDYGVEEEELFEPRREHGTLRSYRGHRVTSDPLADPGQQDLTAHVDFSALKRAGTAAGLVEDFFGSQANFLTGIVQRISQEPVGFGEWTPAQTRQFQTLTHPQHLGRSFRMLIQAKRGSGSVSNG